MYSVELALVIELQHAILNSYSACVTLKEKPGYFLYFYYFNGCHTEAKTNFDFSLFTIIFINQPKCFCSLNPTTDGTLELNLGLQYDSPVHNSPPSIHPKYLFETHFPVINIAFHSLKNYFAPKHNHFIIMLATKT